MLLDDVLKELVEGGVELLGLDLKPGSRPRAGDPVTASASRVCNWPTSATPRTRTSYSCSIFFSSFHFG